MQRINFLKKYSAAILSLWKHGTLKESVVLLKNKLLHELSFKKNLRNY